MTLRVEAVLIETTRLAELRDFYRRGFDLGEPATAEDDQVGFQIGDVYFGLEAVEERPEASRSMSLWLKIDDARAAYARLMELGATTKDEPAEVDDELIASVYDPDGNVIGLISEL
jgi:predicted enzyme related to lactoylglutathione lyase